MIGCGPGDQPHAHLETEHLSFHGQLDGACEGLGVLYEREVDRIALELGRGPTEPIDVYVGLDEVERRCPPGTSARRTSGCVVSKTEIATTLDVLSFALVEATRQQHGVHGVPFVEEALPYMIGYGRPSAGFVVEATPEDFERAIDPELEPDGSEASSGAEGLAIHFLHWVEQAYGSEALQAWLWSEAVREGTHVAAAFAAATGETIDVAEARWREEAERYAMFDGLCHGRPTPPLPADGLVVEGSACCGDEGVEQLEPSQLSLGSQCFSVPSNVEVDVELLAGDGELVLRPDGCEAWPDTSPLVLRAGEAATVTLTPCRWKAMVVGPEHCEKGQGIRYAITPAS